MMTLRQDQYNIMSYGRRRFLLFCYYTCSGTLPTWSSALTFLRHCFVHWRIILRSRLVNGKPGVFAFTNWDSSETQAWVRRVVKKGARNGRARLQYGALSKIVRCWDFGLYKVLMLDSWLSTKSLLMIRFCGWCNNLRVRAKGSGNSRSTTAGSLLFRTRTRTHTRKQKKHTTNTSSYNCASRVNN